MASYAIVPLIIRRKCSWSKSRTLEPDDFKWPLCGRLRDAHPFTLVIKMAICMHVLRIDAFRKGADFLRPDVVDKPYCRNGRAYTE